MNARTGRRGSGRHLGAVRFGQDTSAGADASGEPVGTGATGVFHDIRIVHAPGKLPGHLARAAEELRCRKTPDQLTVVVGAGFRDATALRARLLPLATEARDAGAHTVRLVMSGSAADQPGRPSFARELSETGIDVVAPRGLVVIGPGGTAFAPDLPGAPGGWWHFSPGLAPRRIGSRDPAPDWQDAVELVAPDAVGGCVVEQIPAGLLVLPAGAPPEGVEALRYAVPPDAAGPMIVVGATGTAMVTADALAEVVAALPAQVRGSIVLVPGSGNDLLALGQGVADLLDVQIRVCSGMPLLLESAVRGTGGGAGAPRIVLTDATGGLSWQPYVEAVTCAPAAEGDTGEPDAPVLGAWRPPIGGLRPGIEPGAMMLDRKWQVVATRAGLWIGPNGAAVPAEIARTPTAAELMAVDVGQPGRPLDDTLWEPLDRLFTALQDDVRERTLVRSRGECSDDTLRGLRKLTVRHGLALAPRGWQQREDELPAQGLVGEEEFGGTDEFGESGDGNALAVSAVPEEPVAEESEVAEADGGDAAGLGGAVREGAPVAVRAAGSGDPSASQLAEPGTVLHPEPEPEPEPEPLVEIPARLPSQRPAPVEVTFAPPPAAFRPARPAAASHTGLPTESPDPGPPHFVAEPIFSAAPAATGGDPEHAAEQGASASPG